MPGIDPDRAFRPVGIALLTVSDTRDLATDTSGALLVERLERAGHILAARALCRDDADTIEAHLRAWVADPAIEVVLSTGGTGVTARDVTPEAFERVIDKRIEGFGELFRMLSYAKRSEEHTSELQSR